ncbi:hypothetical protein [Nitrosospira briensis]|uniref:hypothetical protein n=1 Tax=Nitrosospira briensis TaxID=35799 RepID=UPI000AF0FE87|nr:hypothetical protein [Nitrosospira briensis]
MDQKFSLLKSGLPLRDIAHRFHGPIRSPSHVAVADTVQYSFSASAFIQSMTVSGSLQAILDELEALGWDRLRWDQADYALSKSLCYLHSSPGSVS